MAKKKMDFEKSLSRIEEIIEEIEIGEIPLDKSVELYKEAMELSVFCAQSLQAAEERIVVLQKTFQNTFELKPFDGE